MGRSEGSNYGWAGGGGGDLRVSGGRGGHGSSLAEQQPSLRLRSHRGVGGGAGSSRVSGEGRSRALAGGGSSHAFEELGCRGRGEGVALDPRASRFPGGAQGGKRRRARGAGVSRRFTRSRAPSTPSGGTSGPRSWSAAARRRRRRWAATPSESGLPERILPSRYLQGAERTGVWAYQRPGPRTQMALQPHTVPPPPQKNKTPGFEVPSQTSLHPHPGPGPPSLPGSQNPRVRPGCRRPPIPAPATSAVRGPHQTCRPRRPQPRGPRGHRRRSGAGVGVPRQGRGRGPAARPGRRGPGARGAGRGPAARRARPDRSSSRPAAGSGVRGAPHRRNSCARTRACWSSASCASARARSCRSASSRCASTRASSCTASAASPRAAARRKRLGTPASPKGAEAAPRPRGSCGKTKGAHQARDPRPRGLQRHP